MRFTIRDIIWLTLVVALAAGWATDRHHQQRVIQAARNHQLRAGDMVELINKVRAKEKEDYQIHVEKHNARVRQMLTTIEELSASPPVKSAE